jgi:hypothetical protein
MEMDDKGKSSFGIKAFSDLSDKTFDQNIQALFNFP